MSDALFEVQKAVYALLAANSGVQALIGNPARIYDHAPADAAFPYVTFGAVSATPFDTISQTGLRQMVTLTAWSRYRGRKEAKDILQAIYDALHRASLTVSGQVFVSCEFKSAEVAVESDGLTTRADAQYEIITQSS